MYLIQKTKKSLLRVLGVFEEVEESLLTVELTPCLSYTKEGIWNLNAFGFENLVFILAGLFLDFYFLWAQSFC